MIGASPAHRRASTLLGALVTAALLVLVTGCTPLLSLFGSTEPDANFVSYGSQDINWGNCQGGGRDMQCASVYAPMDWADADAHVDSDTDADSDTKADAGAEVEPTADSEPGAEAVPIAHQQNDILLRIVKHPAEGGEAIGTLFVNRGGPGATGVDYLQTSYQSAVQADVREKYDVISWDPRGVGQSSAVHCLDDAGFDEFLYGTGDPEEDGANLKFGSDAWIESGIEASGDFGAACLNETGELLGHIDTMSTVRDLDMLREIVGDKKLNYLGYSYGTQIGALYADEMPERVGRLVLDGAMDPSTTLTETARAQAVGIETALRGYVTDCLTRADCPLSGASKLGNAQPGNTETSAVETGMTQIDKLLKKVEAKPIRNSDGRMLYDSTLFTAMVATLYSPELWTHLDQIISEVGQGKADHAFALADYYNDRVDGVYQSNMIEAFLAITCVDYPREDADFDAMRAEAAKTMKQAPVAGRFHSFGAVSCAEWPVPSVDVVHAVTGAGADPILIIGTTGDPATPIRWARSLAEQLESGVLLTYEGEGHTAYGENACVNDMVNEYLLTGVTPGASEAVCQ